MSVRVSLRELEQQLPTLLERVAKDGEECVVQRNGKDYAVIIGVQQWNRRTLGEQLDALGPSLRLDEAKQARVEHLLASKASRPLTAAERRELRCLIKETEGILRRRTTALDQLP